MGDDEEEKTPAGRYLKRRMAELGFQRKADLADTAGVSRSTITRLFSNADYRPDIDNLRKLATALEVEPDALTAEIYGEATPPKPVQMHPLAAELARMLATGSPLAEEARSTLEAIVEVAVQSRRREMRNAAAAAARVVDGVIHIGEVPDDPEVLRRASAVHRSRRDIPPGEPTPAGVEPSFTLHPDVEKDVVPTSQALRLSWLTGPDGLPPAAARRLTLLVETAMSMVAPWPDEFGLGDYEIVRRGQGAERMPQQKDRREQSGVRER